MDKPDWKFAIDVFPAEWECPSEPFWVAGWITSPGGKVPVDIRAWLGDEPFLGVCGLPRPDVETSVRGHAGPPYAGFTFRLNPVPAAKEIWIEVCDNHGVWTEFFRHTVSTPAGDYRDDRLSRATQPLLRFLQAKYSRPKHSWSDLARETIASERSIPLDTLPNPPFQGALEQPMANSFVRHGYLLITGWLAHREHLIVRLTAFLDSQTPQPLIHGLPRADVGELFAGLRNGATSRFAGLLQLPPELPQPVALRIFAELEDGRNELVFTKRFRPLIVSGAEIDFPSLSKITFARAALALWRAGWLKYWPTGTAFTLKTLLNAAWIEYRAQATPTKSPGVHPLKLPASPSRALKVILVTHNLNLEGAPLIAFEYARHLAAQPGWSVSVVSPEDGPLKAAYVAAGLKVDLIDVRPALGTGTSYEFDRALDRLTDQLNWKEADLIVANTMVAFWSILIAHRLKRPSIFYLHESVSARRFFAPHLAPQLLPLVESAFSLATRVVFSAASSQRIHAALRQRDNFQVLHGWIDVPRIDAYVAAHSSRELRRTHGFPENAVIFANIGSVCVRKGQHIFVQAIEHLLRNRVAKEGSSVPSLIFLMVGAYPDPYLDILRAELERLALPGVHLVNQVTDSYPYYRLADIFVCSSFEEAFPRVVMEAASFGLPIVSTNVNGIPEMLQASDAWLVPPGDPGKLSVAMSAALDAHLSGDRSRATRAQRLVNDSFSTTILFPQHVALAVETSGPFIG